MGDVRRLDLDQRLEVYFETLRASPLHSAIRRGMANWQLYAAVSGSAMAMATGASAALIGTGVRTVNSDPVASARSARQNVRSFNGPPFVDVLKLATGVGSPGHRLGNGAHRQIDAATQSQAPSIAAGGVVPLFSAVSVIQPGEWVSIYGGNLAGETASWKGDFPVSLGGTSVTIDGRPAYLSYVSPDQINLQAPDNSATGPVLVVVTNAAGKATSTVTLSAFAPSFSLLGNDYVCGIILRSNRSGAYGGGAYDILGPTGDSLGYPTVAAQPGDTVELFGFGFGPTNPAVPAGAPFSGAAPISNGLVLSINNVIVQPLFVGLSSAGLYQFNLIVPPGLGGGEVPIQAFVGGMQTQLGVLFSLQGNPTVYPVGAGGTVGGVIGIGSGSGFAGGTAGNPVVGTGGGTGGMQAPGTGGGTGGAPAPGSGGGAGTAAFRHGKKPYQPRLQFPLK